MAKIAIVITNNFEDVEFTEPQQALELAGHTTNTIGFEAGEKIVGKKGLEVVVDLGIDDVAAEQFDAMLIPGGYSPDKLRADARFLSFVRHFSENKKPIFSICHGPQLLVNADVLRGKDATGVKQVGVDISNAGGNFIDTEVVVDQSGLITSRTPKDLPAFNQAIVKALTKI